MVLDAKGRLLAVAQPFDGAVEQRKVRDLQGVGKAVRIDDEAVVLAGNLDTAGGEVLDRMVRAPVAALHFGGAGPHGKRHQLVTDADSEDGKAGIDDRGNFAGRVAAGGGWVAGAVRQEHTVGLHGEDGVRLGFGRHNGDVTSGVGQAA